MAEVHARDINAFAHLPGVGGAKLSRYAQTLSEVSHEPRDGDERAVRRLLADAARGRRKGRFVQSTK